MVRHSEYSCINTHSDVFMISNLKFTSHFSLDPSGILLHRMTKTGKLGNIVEDDYYRVLEVSRRMVNPRTVIFATSAINNNALKMDGFESLRKDNAVLRQFVANYKIPYYSNRGVQNVLLLDWEKLTDALVLANAETMNIPPEMAFKHQVSCEGLSKRHSFTGARYCPQ